MKRLLLQKVLNFKRHLLKAFTSEISNSRIIHEDDIKKLNEEFPKFKGEQLELIKKFD